MTRSALTLVAALTLFVGLAQRASADMDCGDFSSHAGAQEYFEANGGSAFNNVDLLDEDGDGLACDWGPTSGFNGSTRDNDEGYSFTRADYEAEKAAEAYEQNPANDRDYQRQQQISENGRRELKFGIAVIVVALMIAALVGRSSASHVPTTTAVSEAPAWMKTSGTTTPNPKDSRSANPERSLSDDVRTKWL